MNKVLVLDDNMVEAMMEHFACLLLHHGSTAIGKSIEEAAYNVKVLEDLAKLQYEVMLVGKPESLPQSMLDRLVERARKNGLLV